MFAVVGNLTVPDDPRPAALSGPEFFDFDVAVLGLGFHHFEHPALSAQRLVERLRPGGVLVILDFVTHSPHGGGSGGGGGGHHGASHTVLHHGFSEAQMKAIFEEAGAGTHFAFQEMGSGVVFAHGADQESRKRRVFLARGEKAPGV